MADDSYELENYTPNLCSLCLKIQSDHQNFGAE